MMPAVKRYQARAIAYALLTGRGGEEANAAFGNPRRR